MTKLNCETFVLIIPGIRFRAYSKRECDSNAKSNEDMTAAMNAARCHVIVRKRNAIWERSIGRRLIFARLCHREISQTAANRFDTALRPRLCLPDR